jgi:hypothetical protein
MRIPISFIATVWAPIFIGGMIYVLLRSDKLLMFQWFDKMGLARLINEWRGNTYVKHGYPDWLVYNLPDALWVFAFTNFMLIVWKNKLTIHSIAWILLAPLSGIISEVGQALHLVSGTFDIIDLTFILVASVAPFLYLIYPKFKKLCLKV